MIHDQSNAAPPFVSMVDVDLADLADAQTTAWRLRNLVSDLYRRKPEFVTAVADATGVRLAALGVPMSWPAPSDSASAAPASPNYEVSS